MPRILKLPLRGHVPLPIGWCMLRDQGRRTQARVPRLQVVQLQQHFVAEPRREVLAGHQRRRHVQRCAHPRDVINYTPPDVLFPCPRMHAARCPLLCASPAGRAPGSGRWLSLFPLGAFAFGAFALGGFACSDDLTPSNTTPAPPRPFPLRRPCQRVERGPEGCSLLCRFRFREQVARPPFAPCCRRPH
jgi:hypothetical protein